MSSSYYEKDPDITKTWEVDWRAEYLPVGVNISGVVVSVPAGVTLVGSSFTNDTTLFSLSGGTAGEVYECVHLATFDDGDSESRVVKVFCVET